jgi:hypothetical protein
MENPDVAIFVSETSTINLNTSQLLLLHEISTKNHQQKTQVPL